VHFTFTLCRNYAYNFMLHMSRYVIDSTVMSHKLLTMFLSV